MSYQLTFDAVAETPPGAKWRARWRRSWAAYCAWFERTDVNRALGSPLSVDHRLLQPARTHFEGISMLANLRTALARRRQSGLGG